MSIPIVRLNGIISAFFCEGNLQLRVILEAGLYSMIHCMQLVLGLITELPFLIKKSVKGSLIIHSTVLHFSLSTHFYFIFHFPLSDCNVQAWRW